MEVYLGNMLVATENAAYFVPEKYIGKTLFIKFKNIQGHLDIYKKTVQCALHTFQEPIVLIPSAVISPNLIVDKILSISFNDQYIGIITLEKNTWYKVSIANHHAIFFIDQAIKPCQIQTIFPTQKLYSNNLIPSPIQSPIKSPIKSPNIIQSPIILEHAIQSPLRSSIKQQPIIQSPLQKHVTFNQQTYTQFPPPPLPPISPDHHYDKERWMKPTLPEDEKKYCRCVLHVAAKQSDDCNKNKNWGSHNCYNPYAVCAKSTRSSSRRCGENYIFENIPDDHLTSYASLNNIPIPEQYSNQQMLSNIHRFKRI